MNCSTTAQVLSVERLSTTSTSCGMMVWRVAFSRQSRMRSASFHAGMMIETLSITSTIEKRVYAAGVSELQTPRYNGEP